MPTTRSKKKYCVDVVADADSTIIKCSSLFEFSLAKLNETVSKICTHKQQKKSKRKNKKK